MNWYTAMLCALATLVLVAIVTTIRAKNEEARDVPEGAGEARDVPGGAEEAPKYTVCTTESCKNRTPYKWCRWCRRKHQWGQFASSMTGIHTTESTVTLSTPIGGKTVWKVTHPPTKGELLFVIDEYFTHIVCTDCINPTIVTGFNVNHVVSVDGENVHPIVGFAKGKVSMCLIFDLAGHNHCPNGRPHFAEECGYICD